ncbi:hypothetical protein D9M69_681230 [compost metagenome]
MPVFLEEVRALLRVPHQAALGGDHGLVAAALERGAHDVFGSAQAIGRRGVDQRHPGVQRGVDGLGGAGAVLAAPHPAAHGPGAQADGRAFDARGA